MRPVYLLFLALAALLLVPKLIDGGGAVAAPSTSNGLLLPYASRSSTDSSGATSTTTTAAATATRTSTPVPTSTGATATATSTSTGSTILNAWRMNTANATSVALSGVKTDVQSITVTAVSGTPEAKMVAAGIPSYAQTMTSSTRATLVARPQASTDFRTPSAPSVGVGTPVSWGQDIGYKSTQCPSPTPGGGYWPKGPSCASNQNYSVHFPLTPVAATTNTTTSIGAVGFWVNGVAVYNWSDNQSYNNAGVWYRTAADWEKYDMDIDNGHSTQQGAYHHHFYPNTLAAQLGDTGTGHSPVYGFAADGYPIRGPWHANGVLAQSGWQKRDYSASSPTGCGTANKRTCLMVDQANKSAGTATASSAGPDTTASTTTSNGNPVSMVSGVFAQDYYHDTSGCTVAAACLDKFNGHEHDGLGWHYHVTVTQSDGSFTPVFPYIVGLQYKGTLPSNTFVMPDRRSGSWAPPKPAAVRP